MLILIRGSYSLWQEYKDPTRGPRDAKSIMHVRFFVFAGPVLVPLATVVVVPLMTGVRLRGMLTNEPGLTHAFLILSALQIVYGVLRITLTFRKPGLESAAA